MRRHAINQKRSWNLERYKTPEEKAIAVDLIKKGIHDPLSWDGGLTTGQVLQWRGIGKFYVL
jgi:hypothetical protein